MCIALSQQRVGHSHVDVRRFFTKELRSRSYGQDQDGGAQHIPGIVRVENRVQPRGEQNTVYALVLVF